MPMVDMNMAVMAQVVHDYQHRAEAIAAQEARQAELSQALAEIEDRIVAARSYEQALSQHVEELDARLESLRAQIAPEERGLQARLAELHVQIERTQQALSTLQSMHQRSLDEQAAIVRRQLGGTLDAPPPRWGAPEPDAEVVVLEVAS
jgi:chromosome segregation ATPase